MGKNDQSFNLNFDAKLNISQAQTALKSFQSSLNGLKLPNQLFGTVNKDITKLESSLRDFQVLTSKNQFNNSDVQQAVKLYKEISEKTKIEYICIYNSQHLWKK